MTARAGGAEALPDWSGPVLALREDGWSASIDLLGPRGDFGEQFRDIDLYGLTLGRSWQFGYGLELRALASGVVARDERSEPFSPTPPLHSDAEGLAFGGGLRQYLLDWQGLHLFAEGSVQFLWTMGTPFPAGGSGVNGLVRWGGGAGYDLGPGLRLEMSYQRAHISNGGGIVASNPAWKGPSAPTRLRGRARHRPQPSTIRMPMAAPRRIGSTASIALRPPPRPPPRLLCRPQEKGRSHRPAFSLLQAPRTQPRTASICCATSSMSAMPSTVFNTPRAA